MSGPGGILALDLSLTTGWAYGVSRANRPSCGLWLLGRMDHLGRVNSGLAQCLEDAISLHQPSLVIFEAPIVKQQTTARALIYLCGVVELICYERSVDCREAAAPTARKLVLGRGSFREERAGKMVSNNKSVVTEWATAQGWDPPDHNAADARVLWQYACLMRAGRSGGAA